MKRARKFFRYDNIGYLFVLPAFIYMMIFVGYPIVDNLILSFQQVTIQTLTAAHKPFAGLENCPEIFKDPVFHKALMNTLIFTVACLVVQL